VPVGGVRSPGWLAAESTTAKDLAAAIMGSGGRVTPGHKMTWGPPTPSPAEELPFGNRCCEVYPSTAAVIKLEGVRYYPQESTVRIMLTVFED